MPYKDKDKALRVDRNYHRTKRHGNWRAVLDYWNGLCTQCGEEAAHLHEHFGEDKAVKGKLQQRIPLCVECHQQHHPNRIAPTISQYLDDMSLEIAECGSYKAWCEKYSVPYPDGQLVTEGME